MKNSPECNQLRKRVYNLDKNISHYFKAKHDLFYKYWEKLKDTIDLSPIAHFVINETEFKVFNLFGYENCSRDMGVYLSFSGNFIISSKKSQDAFVCMSKKTQAIIFSDFNWIKYFEVFRLKIEKDLFVIQRSSAHSFITNSICSRISNACQSKPAGSLEVPILQLLSFSDEEGNYTKTLGYETRNFAVSVAREYFNRLVLEDVLKIYQSQYDEKINLSILQMHLLECATSVLNK